MAHDLIRHFRRLGSPRVLVVGDLTLDRYVWGDVAAVNREAPVPLLRADSREHRLGGAGGVASILSALGAEVRLLAAVGRDPESVVVRKLLSDQGIDDRLVVAVDDRPTSLTERYLGRAADRHPQPVLRVDSQGRDRLPPETQAFLRGQTPEAVSQADVVVVFDNDQGVCTPDLLRALVTAGRTLDVRVIAKPAALTDDSKFQGVHALTTNRFDASAATGARVDTPDEAAAAARVLALSARAECVIVTLGRDGMAVARQDGRERLIPTRAREVYDATGAGAMVLAVVGLGLASGLDYEDAASLANVAAGLEVERVGLAAVSREEILAGLVDHERAPRRYTVHLAHDTIAGPSGRPAASPNGAPDPVGERP